MARRTKSLAATIAILMMILSSLFAGTTLAESNPAGDDEARGLEQAGGLTTDFLCRSFYTNQFRVAFSPSCPPGHQLIIISQQMPFDYCYSLTTRIMSDDLANNTCPAGQRYFVEDGTTSSFVCLNRSTGQIYHLTSPSQCTFGTLVFLIDLRANLTKYACVEENLHHHLCDVLPAGVPQNEIRQLDPVIPTPLFNSQFRLEFRDDQTATLSALSMVDTSPAGIQAALAALPSIGGVGGNVIVTALDPGEFWTTAADDFQTPEDESTPIRVEFTGTLGAQDITDPIILVNVQGTSGGQEYTVIDGSPNSPGLSNVLPGGMVEVFQATGATDPDNPATYGAPVTAGPQPVNAAGAFTLMNLLDGNYVVCASSIDAIAPSCELFTIAGLNVTIINNVDLPGMISAAITDTVGGNEIRSYDDFPFGGGAVTGGTYTITFDTETTAAIAYDATAAQVQAALELLTNIDAGDVSVTGGPPPVFGPPIVIEFTGNYAGVDVPNIIIDSTNLVGGVYFQDPNLTDRDGFGTVQTLTADGRVSGGTFTLTYDNGTTVSTTGSLDFDATVAEIEVALNALESITAGGGSVSLSSTDPDIIPGNEPITKAPIEVRFINVMNSDTNVLIVDNTLLE